MSQNRNKNVHYSLLLFLSFVNLISLQIFEFLRHGLCFHRQYLCYFKFSRFLFCIPLRDFFYQHFYNVSSKDHLTFSGELFVDVVITCIVHKNYGVYCLELVIAIKIFAIFHMKRNFFYFFWWNKEYFLD